MEYSFLWNHDEILNLFFFGIVQFFIFRLPA